MLIHDLRYALRQMRRAPGFATTVVLTLALSVGVATAVFSVIDAVILRPLPYAHPERIVDVVSLSRSGYTQPASWPSFKDERAQQQTFAAFAGYVEFTTYTAETPASGPVLLRSVESTGNFFQVFGVHPLLGRTYLAGEEQDGKNDVAVLGYDTWQKYFNGDRTIVNRAVKLDGREFTIIGVMPPGFRFPLTMQDAIYTPHLITQDWMNGRGNHWLRTVGRLKDGVALAQAQADITQVFHNIARAYPGTDEGRTVHLHLLEQSVNEYTRGPLWTLLGAVLAVLAIGCVNIAGLLLARGLQRQREMAMRTAIGAGRARLIRQVLTEALALAALGAAGGVLLAWAMLEGMRTFLIHALARGADIELNWTVLGAAIAASVLASVVSALYPALRMAKVDPNQALKSGGGAGISRGQHRLRAVFVVTQVALTLVLLVVSSLLIRMVMRYSHEDFGFNPAQVLTAEINLSPARYQGRDVIADFYQPLFDRVGNLPGVRAVGAINLVPIREWGSNSDIHIAGQPPTPPNREALAENRFVSTGYFNVFQIPQRVGRALSPTFDKPENPGSSVVVNDAFVKKFIPPGLDPTIQRIQDSDKEEDWTRIVGVTGNIRQDIYQPPMAERDWLMNELSLKDRISYLSSMNLVMRIDGDPAQLIPALRKVIHDIDPTVPFKEPQTMTQIVAQELTFERMESWLFGIFGGLALALALVGLYGLVSHEVEQARRDIGVRMALGASRNRILAMVMRRVSWMLTAGTVVGLGLTLLVRKTIDMVIYFEAQKEAAGVIELALLLIAAGLIAALIPAVRAASIEPMQALRTE
jgi:predicted permease